MRVLEEIEAVYRRHYAVFLRVAIAIVGEEQGARDAVHDGFVRAVRHRRRFRSEGSIEGWLWRIVVNESRRRRATERAFVPVDPAELSVTASNGKADQADLRAKIATLPERQRLALFLRYYADLDYAAIAEALAIAPGTVGATLNAARAALRSQLEEVHR